MDKKMVIGIVILIVALGLIVLTPIGKKLTGRTVGGVCGDYICDWEMGEDCFSCAVDCGECPSGLTCAEGEIVSAPGQCGIGPDGVTIYCALGTGNPDDDAGPWQCDETNTCCIPDSAGLPEPCGDGMCDWEMGEGCDNCAVDCGECPPPMEPCGDGYCDFEYGAEDCMTCEVDCGVCPEPPPELDEDTYVNQDGLYCSFSCEMGYNCGPPSYECWEYCNFEYMGQIYGYGCEPSVGGYLVPDSVAWPLTPQEYMAQQYALRGQCWADESAAQADYFNSGAFDTCLANMEVACCSETYAGTGQGSGGTVPV